MDDSLRTLRQLAWAYREIATMDRYRNNLSLHRAVNDNRMIRPVVLIDELPWHEMDFDGSLTPLCQDPALRAVEIQLRRTIYRHRHFPADMVVPPYIGVQRIVRDEGIGICVKERTTRLDERNHIAAHEYFDQLAEEASLEGLHPPVIQYDHEATMRNFQRVGDAIGDILPMRLMGINTFYCTVWDNISTYRGVEPLLIDLAERPEYTHRMVKLLFAFEEERLRQYEELGLLDVEPTLLHCTAMAVSDLPSDGYAGNRVTRKDIWGRGAAQIFASVSAAMHEEFDISYMMEGIGSCGLSYYGCCEPLDRKIHIVEKLPNLRKIGVTPWADARLACQAIAGRYVVAAKPNPASVAVPHLDEDGLCKELGYILDACRDNGCSVDIVLKDISTCHNNPQNIFRWESIAMDMAHRYA